MHVGHLVVACHARAALGLDRVLLVVAGDPWQKRGRVVASARQRLMLVEAAVEGVDGVEASAIEIERDGPSVTADTLEALAGPHRELFLLLGADAVANMGTWRRLDETRDLATVVVVERAGDAAAEPPGPGLAGGSGGDSPARRVVDRAAGTAAGRAAGRRARPAAKSCAPSERTGSTLTGDDAPGAARLDRSSPSPSTPTSRRDARVPASPPTRRRTRRARRSSSSTSATSSRSPTRSCS